MNKEIRSPYHKIHFLDNGIIKLIPITSDESLDKAKNVLAEIKKIAGCIKHPLIVDVRHNISISREARQFYSGKEFADIVTSLALIVESPISKVLANFFLFMNKPPYSTRLFTNEDEAIEWLKDYLE